MQMISSMLGRKSAQIAGVAAVFFALSFAALSADQPNQGAITEQEVNAAQQAWCDGLIEIGKVHKDGGDYKVVAGQLIDDLYDYKEGRVFFKPTLAFGKNTFRDTKEGALSYLWAATRTFLATMASR